MAMVRLLPRPPAIADLRSTGFSVRAPAISGRRSSTVPYHRDPVFVRFGRPLDYLPPDDFRYGVAVALQVLTVELCLAGLGLFGGPCRCDDDKDRIRPRGTGEPS